MKVLISLLLFSLSFGVNAEELKNVLQKHASPYLAMHGDDPVRWQQWNKNTIARAKKEGKLIYVSSGYFSCHWCHVMQRESYKNKNVAEILNNYFIPVKVDREINGALDSKLIDFVERTQGRAGWPLNVFITPEGYPLVGMTYVPTNNFIQILNNISMKWKNDNSSLEEIARKATEELSQEARVHSDNIPAGLGQDYLKRFLMQATTMTDDMSGGFGEQNKFPSFPQLTVMLKAFENGQNNNKSDKNIKQFLMLTLDKMASQGLNDQLGGGFFRYSVDPTWQVPHFEKMLYDNALLASLYIDAARIFNHEKYAVVAKQTLDFMMTVLRSPQGAYIASLSAVDDKGIEGGYYLWQREELKKQLNQDEFKVVELMWQLEGADDLEGGHHLVEVMDSRAAAKMLNLPEEIAHELLSSARKKMLALRQQRNIPRDNKLLAGWNGLALSAFSKAARQFNEPRYKKAAEEIKNYIYQTLWRGKSLARAVNKGKVFAEGELEDYAYVAQGLYDWIEYAGNKKDSAWLNELIEQSWHRFYHNKGWLLAENMLLKYGAGEQIIADGVLPSPSATLTGISLKVAEKYSKTGLKRKTLQALNVEHLDVINQPFWYASHIFVVFDFQEVSKK